jgi:hypothetical protein
MPDPGHIRQVFGVPLLPPLPCGLSAAPFSVRHTHGAMIDTGISAKVQDPHVVTRRANDQATFGSDNAVYRPFLPLLDCPSRRGNSTAGSSPGLLLVRLRLTHLVDELRAALEGVPASSRRSLLPSCRDRWAECGGTRFATDERCARSAWSRPSVPRSIGRVSRPRGTQCSNHRW